MNVLELEQLKPSRANQIEEGLADPFEPQYGEIVLDLRLDLLLAGLLFIHDGDILVQATLLVLAALHVRLQLFTRARFFLVQFAR